MLNTTSIGVVLAISAAVALNASYLMQHAGSTTLAAIDARKPVATFGSLLRSPIWVAGGAVGLTGWALHLGAMRHAPLSVVQATTSHIDRLDTFRTPFFDRLDMAVHQQLVVLHQPAERSQRQSDYRQPDIVAAANVE